MTEPGLGVLAAATALAAFVAGFLRGSIGGGIGLALTPVLTLVLPAQLSLGLTAFLLNLADPIILRYYWGQWDRRELGLTVPTALVGILVGAALVASLPERGLRKVIGAAALLLASANLLLMWRRLRLGAPARHWAVGSTVGLLTGVASAVANSGGTILGPYLAGLGLSNAAVVATGAGALVFSNCLKVATYWGIGFLPWRLVWVALAATPLLYLGAWVGWRVNRRLPRTGFALGLIAIAVAGSLKLLAD